MSLDVLGEDDDIGFGISDIASLARRVMPGGRRGRGRGGPPRGYAPSQVRPQGFRTALPSPLAVAPGGVAPQAGLYPVALGPFVFVAGTGVAQLTLNVNPQTNFRAQRMVTQIGRVGASAAAVSPLMYSGKVGIKDLNITGVPIPLEFFTSTGQDMNILFPQTRPGYLYQMSVGLSAALAGADTLSLYVLFLGSAYQ